MRACGIIAEFDPFHNGHKYLIEQARDEGNTHVAVIMSGNAVQRGTPAFYDKVYRAERAVDNGADIVLELPAPYSCQSAEIFARAGVTALAALGKGVIRHLVFGSEIPDTNLILKAADVADKLKDSKTVKQYIQQGDSYPLALAKACEQEFGSEVAAVFSTPNSTLALEYCRALKTSAPWISPLAVKRVGAAHDSTDDRDGFASASLLREMLRIGEDVSQYMPAFTKDFYIPDLADSIFRYRLLSADKQELLSLPDMNDAIAQKVLKAAAGDFSTAAEMLSACKSKDITSARLRRMALHVVLGVKREDIVPLPFVRILAFNKRGSEILSAGEHILPIDTSLKRLEDTSPQAARVSLLERRAGALRAIGTKKGSVINEYRRDIRMR
ncbi:MAG: nucleotidyltransferase family protein [Ruminococcus sp.]|nr:nucleotidyltransferase family protein [Ruminococcus sp.]